ncbi:AraC-like DNA-binding protein [Arcicella aurantiaca]|uniref:AraC-like DNA-binding protein n=1 Tax=Arcicella aurantiaca TaxID=591202 RepID=A0A316EDG2_9BACT|nr:AraC family transcriptional regulator [Arcicella aurantiaca]PWK28186.1 AraC-like DNA-binding protein [Arcicella aurantiaca]
MLSRVKKWLKSFEKYLFYYHDGFFELPYLSNSPEVMIESLKKMPVTKYNPLEQSILSNNPFTKGEMRYREIETGFWVLATQIEFKVNVHTRAIYDEGGSDYYFLAFSLYRCDIPLVNMHVNKITMPNKSWAIYKPGSEIDAYHYKGTEGLFLNFVFNHTWLNQNLFGGKGSESELQNFLNLHTGHITWEDVVPDAETMAQKIWKNLLQGQEERFNALSLKIQTLELISTFFTNINKEKVLEQTFPQNEADRVALVKVEKILMDNLTEGFMGIEAIAKQINMSESKLKVVFKGVYGQSIYQYFKEKQMVLAFQLLKNPDVQIKNIAASLGYENPGKFTAAFKKYHKILPSEVIK